MPSSTPTPGTTPSSLMMMCRSDGISMPGGPTVAGAVASETIPTARRECVARIVPMSPCCRSGECEGVLSSRLVSMSTSPSSSVSVSGRELAAEVEVDGPAEASAVPRWNRCTRRVVVVGWSHTGRAMIVPLLSRPGTVPVPVGAFDPFAVALVEIYTNESVSCTLEPAGVDRSVSISS